MLYILPSDVVASKVPLVPVAVKYASMFVLSAVVVGALKYPSSSAFVLGFFHVIYVSTGVFVVVIFSSDIIFVYRSLPVSHNTGAIFAASAIFSVSVLSR